MRVGVSFTVTIVAIPGNKARQCNNKIPHHVRIGVLINSDSGGSMRHKQATQPFTDAILPQLGLDCCRHINKFYALMRRNDNFLPDAPQSFLLKNEVFEEKTLQVGGSYGI